MIAEIPSRISLNTSHGRCLEYFHRTPPRFARKEDIAVCHLYGNWTHVTALGDVGYTQYNNVTGSKQHCRDMYIKQHLIIGVLLCRYLLVVPPSHSFDTVKRLDNAMTLPFPPTYQFGLRDTVVVR